MSTFGLALGNIGGIAVIATLVGMLIWRMRRADGLRNALDVAKLKINDLVDANAAYASGVQQRDAAIDGMKRDLDAARRATKVAEDQRDVLLKEIATGNPKAVADRMRRDMERLQASLTAAGGAGKASQGGGQVSPLHAAVSGVIDAAHDAGPEPEWVHDPNGKAGS